MTLAAPLQIAVLGAGAMGSGIASQYACAEHTVRFTTSSPSTARRALKRIDSPGAEWCPSTGEAAEGADIVVEALPEILALKQAELRSAQNVAPNAILCSTTSSLSVGTVAALMGDPTRLVGTHFFNPPTGIPIVELVASDRTSPDVVDGMEDVLRRIGKVPIRVRRDVPGFVANRLQFALLREAMELVDTEVVDARDLDRLIVEGLGRRWAAIGPLATVELGGPELFKAIAARLYPDLSNQTAPPADMRRLRLDDGEGERLLEWRSRILGLVGREFERNS